jgi:hypothetical protein
VVKDAVGSGEPRGRFGEQVLQVADVVAAERVERPPRARDRQAFDGQRLRFAADDPPPPVGGEAFQPAELREVHLGAPPPGRAARALLVPVFDLAPFHASSRRQRSRASSRKPE